jgi:hypothetical protein
MGNTRARKRNPVIVAREALKRTKSHVEGAIRCTDTSGIYEPQTGLRPRTPAERPENQIDTLRDLRLWILAANRELIEADQVIVARMAELGYHPNDLPNTEH